MMAMMLPGVSPDTHPVRRHHRSWPDPMGKLALNGGGRPCPGGKRDLAALMALPHPQLSRRAGGRVCTRRRLAKSAGRASATSSVASPGSCLGFDDPSLLDSGGTSGTAAASARDVHVRILRAQYAAWEAECDGFVLSDDDTDCDASSAESYAAQQDHGGVPIVFPESIPARRSAAAATAVVAVPATIAEEESIDMLGETSASLTPSGAPPPRSTNTAGWTDFDDGFDDGFSDVGDEDAAAEAGDVGTARPERWLSEVTATGLEATAGEWEPTPAQQLMDESNREHCLICYDDMAADDPGQAFAAGTGVSKACRCKYSVHADCVRDWVARDVNGGCLICRGPIIDALCSVVPAPRPNARRGPPITVTIGRPRNRHQAARARRAERRARRGQQQPQGCGIM